MSVRESCGILSCSEELLEILPQPIAVQGLTVMERLEMRSLRSDLDAAKLWKAHLDAGRDVLHLSIYGGPILGTG